MISVSITSHPSPKALNPQVMDNMETDIEFIPGSKVRWGWGDVGCLLSHAAAWKYAADRGLGAAVIFEPDVSRGDLRG